MENTAEVLLEECRKLASTRITTWNDYEVYKSLFKCYGLYGFEKDIAYALGL